MEKKKEIAKVLKVWGLNYSKEITKDLFEFWFSFLKDYSLKEIRRSADKHLKESKFFPKLSEIKIILDENKLKYPDQMEIVRELFTDNEFDIFMTMQRYPRNYNKRLENHKGLKCLK